MINMKFCPECGNKREKNICKCGYNFKKGEMEIKNKEKKRIENENQFLFKEPYFPSNEQSNKPLTFLEQYRLMNPSSNLTAKEIEEQMKSVHFTA